MANTLRLVEKAQYSNQVFLELDPASLGSLGADSIRVKPVSLGLTSANLTYCSLGDLFGWYGAYPLPAATPAPCNDATKYAATPAWGFAEILESNIPAFKVGSLMYGQLPLYTLPVDLQLKPSETVKGQWIETSAHRQHLMPLYNRFNEASEFTKDDLKTAWGSTLRPIWECGYLLNRFVFPGSEEDKAIHPIPEFGLKWSEDDGNLTDALVIVLGAGSKTSRSFVHQMAKNRKGRMPKAVVEVTQSSGALRYIEEVPFETKAITYAESVSGDTIAWLTGQNASRIVIIDFGGRENAVEKLANALKDAGTAPFKIVAVGTEMKVFTGADLAAQSEMGARLGSVLCNTSGMRTKAMEAVGEQAYFDALTVAFRELMQEQMALGTGKVLGLNLVIKNGIRGDDGLEGTWTKLSEGKVGVEDGLVIKF